MKKNMQIIFFTLICGLVFFLLLEYGMTFFQYEKIEKNNNIVFFKNKERGLNYQKLSLSTSKCRYTNIVTDYIYLSEVIFYKIENDSLFIKCRKISNVPSVFNFDIPMEHKELSNPEFMDLYKDYNKKGYHKFPK